MPLNAGSVSLLRTVRSHEKLGLGRVKDTSCRTASPHYCPHGFLILIGSGL
jgi:hypothetical protein